MFRLRAITVSAVLTLLLCAAAKAPAQAVPSNTGETSATLPRALQNVGFEPTLNTQMPLETTFTSDNLKKTYGGRLAILDAAGDALASEGAAP